MGDGGGTSEEQIRNVETQILNVEEQISEVEEQIRRVGEQIDRCLDGEERKLLRVKETQLRDEKAELRVKETQLRVKETQLRSEKAELRVKETQLRSEKAELRVKETQLREQGREFQAKKLVGFPEEGINARKDSYCSMRRTTAVKLCEIVDEKGAVLIRAPPGSGKTSLLQLIAQVNTRNMFEDVYYISLADLSGSERTFESLWTEWHRGVDLNEIRSPKDSTRPYLILVDEGQAAFDMKLTIWGTLKNIVGGHRKNLRMIVVSAWGSEIVSEDGKMVPTRVWFPKSATVSLWPTDTGAGVSLQLTQDEAMEVWDGWCQMVLGVGDSLMSFDDFRDYIFTLTGRHPGSLLHILDWLRQQGLVKIPAGSRKQKAQTLLLSSEFYDSLSSLRSLLRLSKALRGGDQNAEPMRGLVRLLLREEPLRRSTLSGPVKDAAEKAVLWGQVMEEQDSLKIPSQLHRLFLCRELYCSADASVASIREEGLLSFVRRVIERLEPTRLQFSESRSVKDRSVYERQYQSEFYRAACTITSKDTPLSPDVGPLYGARGFLDFFLSPLGWGFEMLRDGSNLEEHVLRFGPGSAYDKLVKDEVVKEYVILDFRMKSLVEDVQVNPFICHVVFSNDFKMATLHTFGRRPETLLVGPTGLRFGATFGSGPETLHVGSKRKQRSSTKEDEADYSLPSINVNPRE